MTEATSKEADMRAANTKEDVTPKDTYNLVYIACAWLGIGREKYYYKKVLLDHVFSCMTSPHNFLDKFSIYTALSVTSSACLRVVSNKS